MGQWVRKKDVEPETTGPLGQPLNQGELGANWEIAEAISPEPGSALEAAARGGLTGAAMGFMFGGPPGAVAGGFGGAAGELTARELEQRGTHPMLAMGGGFGADLTASALTRNPTAIARRIVPGGRATRLMQDIGVDVGREGPEEVVEAARQGYRQLGAAERADWRAIPPTEATVSSRPLTGEALAVQRSQALTPEFTPSTARRIPEVLPQEVGIEDVQDVLSAVGREQRAAALNPELAEMARESRRIRGAAEETLDLLEEAAPESAQALRAARASSARKHAAAPTRSQVFKSMIGANAIEEPEKAIRTVFNSRQPISEARRLMTLIDELPEGVERVRARRGLNRAALKVMFGEAAEESPRSAKAALTMGAQREKTMRTILGDRAFERIRGTLRDVYTGTKRGQKFAPLVFHAGLLPQGGTGAAVGAAVASAAGLPWEAGAAAGYLMGRFANWMSPQNVRQLAMEGLTNPDVGEKLLRRYGQREGVTIARRMLESAVRRGALEADALAEFEAAQEQ